MGAYEKFRTSAFSKRIYQVLAFQKLWQNTSFYLDREEAKEKVNKFRPCYLSYKFFAYHFCILTILYGTNTNNNIVIIMIVLVIFLFSVWV